MPETLTAEMVTSAVVRDLKKIEKHFAQFQAGATQCFGARMRAMGIGFFVLADISGELEKAKAAIKDLPVSQTSEIELETEKFLEALDLPQEADESEPEE